MWIRLSSIMYEAIELFVPKSCSNGKKIVQWMDRKALRASKNKMKLWTKYKESKTYNDWIEYKRVSNKAVKEYRKAKKKFEEKNLLLALKTIQSHSTRMYVPNRVLKMLLVQLWIAMAS